MRTGAVPFGAARYLAKKDSSVLAIIGAGVIGTASVICAMAEYHTINIIKISEELAARAADIRRLIQRFKLY